VGNHARFRPESLYDIERHGKGVRAIGHLPVLVRHSKDCQPIPLNRLNISAMSVRTALLIALGVVALLGALNFYFAKLDKRRQPGD
jgi:hypothetical protein